MAEPLDLLVLNEQPPFLRIVAAAERIRRLVEESPGLLDPQGLVSQTTIDRAGSVREFRWFAQLPESPEDKLSCRLSIDTHYSSGEKSSEMLAAFGCGSEGGAGITAQGVYNGRHSTLADSPLLKQLALATEAEEMVNLLQAAVRAGGSDG